MFTRRWSRCFSLIVPFVCILCYLAFDAGWANADEAKTDAARLVREVRDAEQWINQAKSLRLFINARWLKSSEAIESRKAQLKKQHPQTDITPERFPELLAEQTDTIELAFDEHRIYERQESKNENYKRNLRFWDGTQGFADELFSTEEHYGLFKEPYQYVGEDFFPHLAWPRVATHDLWWVPANFRMSRELYGEPEEFQISQRTTFHGHECYVAEKGYQKLFIGIADHRLYGMENRVIPRSASSGRNAALIAVAKSFGKELPSAADYNQWRNSLADDQKREVTNAFVERVRPLSVVQFTHFLDDYREVSPGRWMPMFQGYDTYNNNEGPNPALVTSTRELRITRAEVDQPLPDELFKLEMKDGVTVYDRRYDPYLVYPYQKKFTKDQWSDILNDGKLRASAIQARTVQMDRAIGLPAPDFGAATWVNSPAFSWTDLKGKVVLVDFWATWCAPCRNDYPKLVELDKQKADTGIVIIGIHASGTPEPQVRAMMKDFGMEYAVCIDTSDNPESRFGKLFQAYGIAALPQAYVVGRDGKIAAHGTFAQAASVARKMAAESK